MRLAAVLFVLALVASGCGTEDDAAETAHAAAAAGDDGSVADDEVPSAVTALGFTVLEQLRQDGNVALSPLSLASVLAMLRNGASGTTAAAIDDALGLGELDEATINAALEELLASLGEAGDTSLTTASAVWADDTTPLEADFVARVGRAFGADLEVADLGAATTADAMDRWVRDATGGTVDGIAGDLGVPDAAMELVLLSAVHFAGTWTHSFPVEGTAEGSFTLPDGSTVTVPFMARTGELQQARGRGFTMVRLPYGADERFVMDVILPDGSIADLELDQLAWSAAARALETSTVALRMPRFDVQFVTDDGELDHVLVALGMAAAYGDEADFTRLSANDPELSTVVHKARLTIDEEGTTAGAVSGSGMRGEPPAVDIDRPFLVVVSDTDTGVALFLAAVRDPR